MPQIKSDQNFQKGSILPILIVVVLIVGIFVATQLTSVQQIFNSRAYDGGSSSTAQVTYPVGGACTSQIVSHKTKEPCGAIFLCADGYRVEIGGTRFTVGPGGATFISKCSSFEEMKAEAQKICDLHPYCEGQPEPKTIIPVRDLYVDCNAPNNKAKLSWKDNNVYSKQDVDYLVRFTSSFDGAWNYRCKDAQKGRDSCIYGGSPSSPSMEVGITPGTRYEFSVAPFLKGSASEGPESSTYAFICH